MNHMELFIRRLNGLLGRLSSIDSPNYSYVIDIYFNLKDPYAIDNRFFNCLTICNRSLINHYENSKACKLCKSTKKLFKIFAGT